MYRKQRKLPKSFFLSIFLAGVLLLSACSGAGTADLVHQFQSYGADFAKKVATTYPRRPAGSEAETALGDMIFEEFTRLGFKPEFQEVNLPDGGKSRNVIVRIPGTGFTADEDRLKTFNYDIYDRRAKAEDGLFHRNVVIGARYDTDPEAAEESDGISDNASGLGALLLTGQTLKRYKVGYDVTLVALGGGFADLAGARIFVESLDADKMAMTDIFYEYRNLYAGEKLYGHAGWSSLKPDSKYKFRQPLYAIQDLAIEERLLDKTGIALYGNQSTYKVDNPLGEGQVVFRDFSLHQSDYRAFDEKGIPVVFFESYNYGAEKQEDLAENNDPNYQSTNFKVSGTAFDNTESLEKLSEKQFLERRINATVYLVYLALEQGVLGGQSYSLVS